MKRTGFGPRKAPMSRSTSTLKRSGFSAKPAAPMARSSIKPSGKPMKASRPKMTPIRKSAKDEDCLIVLNGVCNFDSSTVVWCHENSYEAGKGMGLKARDENGCYGCSACHAVYDRQVTLPSWLTREYVDERFAIAKQKSQEKLRQKNLLKDECGTVC